MAEASDRLVEKRKAYFKDKKNPEEEEVRSPTLLLKRFLFNKFLP